MTVRTRFAPSPTGFLHIGGARTALFSWLHARHHGGGFVLRIEDTDRERSTAESVAVILESMAWLGLEYDEGPIFQTQRFDRYHEVLSQLLSEGKAYRCYCSKERLTVLRAEQMARGDKPRYDGHCRDIRRPPLATTPSVIRFLNPNEGTVVVPDLIRGAVEFRNDELDDLILARTDGTPTYNLTVVVDDLDMAITHVIRGDDHLNNTPRQINIFQALGSAPPSYAHVPMIMGPDGQRLSKRHGAVSVLQYRQDGYLPEALLNYLVRLGWSHGDQEVFTLDEMVDLFDVRDVNRAASTFDPDKLLWLNQHYIKNVDSAHIARHLSWQMGRLNIDPAGGAGLIEVVMVQRERSKTLREMAQNSVFFYEDFDDYDPAAAKKHLKPSIIGALMRLREDLEAVSHWAASNIHEVIVDNAEAGGLKLGQLAQPLRVAVCGRAASPPIDTTLELLGRERALARIDRAIAYLRRQETHP
ncbi:MAG: glutamate--tRNA ligase [Gammaproteobacteria bacterium]